MMGYRFNRTTTRRAQALIGTIAIGLLAGCGPAPLPVTPTQAQATAPALIPAAQSSATVARPTEPSPTPAASSTVFATGTILRVDHSSIDLFDEIPVSYLEAAAALRMAFVDRSVGLNISQGLDCLASPSDEQARHSCRVLEHTDPGYSVSEAELDWARPGGYDRSQWDFLPFAETGCGRWNETVNCFIALAHPVAADYDVLSYQFSYLEVAPGSTIADPSQGFFADSPDGPDIGDLERFEAEHPDKVFILTTSLARSIGSEEARAFNEQMRQYALSHGKPLFDVADILSHDPDGRPCFDNRDGVAYRSENYSDDGLDLPAICPHYTTETDGGHLGSVSVGAIRVAKAFWVLMAQIAGWQP
jgi:hypothetical protein